MRELRAHATEELLKRGVSIAHLQVIWQLETNGGELSMGRIADLLGVSVSNATGLVDRMEERGLVVRVRSTDDRRAVNVRPTEAGIEAARTMELMRTETTEAVLDRLDDAQLARLGDALTDWIDALEVVIRDRSVPHATPAAVPTRGMTRPAIPDPAPAGRDQ